MTADTNADTFKPAAPAEVPQASTAEQEMMKIELEIQRQAALKAAYATMMAQTEQEIQGLLFARMRLQAAARGLNMDEVTAAKAEIEKNMTAKQGE
jgi:hypothetical protein